MILAKNICFNYNVISNCRVDSFPCPVVVKVYLLAQKDEKNEFYEIFTGRKIENEASTHQDGYVYQNFNIPYIEKVEPLTSYLVKDLKQIDISLLFDFLVDLNVSNYVESEYNN